MKSLFPEMERELREERLAARREQIQHARARLKNYNFNWTINYLLENGPKTEVCAMMDAQEGLDIEKRGVAVRDVLFSLYDLWLTGKLWRVSQGRHAGSGEESFLYGIKKVHKKP